MTIEKSINRLIWRFGERKSFVPNENDIEALKFLVNWVENQKSEAIQDNTIFAKMYVYCFIHELAFYKDVSFAQKKLHETLLSPLSDQYKAFKDKINELELEKYMREYGLDKDFINKEKILEQKNTITKVQEQLKKLVIGKWSKEQIDRSLNNQVTESINKYKKLP